MSRGLLRKLAIGLAVSLAFNMFFLGVLSVQLLRPANSARGGPPEGAPRRPPPGEVGPRALFHAEEIFGRDRPRISRVLRTHKGELRSRWHETKRARSRVEAALRAEPFDRDLLARELEGLRHETQRSQEVLHRALVEMAAEATPEQRRHLAAWADDQRPHRGLRRGQPLPKPPPGRSAEPGAEPGAEPDAEPGAEPGADPDPEPEPKPER